MTTPRDTAPEKPAGGVEGGAAASAPEPGPAPDVAVAPEEPDTGPPVAKASTVRKSVQIVAALLVLLYVYNVVADRITPYTSQATVDTFLVQIAPEITGRVSYVGVTDNSNVRRGQVLFRVDHEPFEIALRAAQANLASAIQAAGVSSTEIEVAQAELERQRVDLAASRTLGRITFNLVRQGALPETNAIRARADIDTSEANLVRQTAEVERARRRLGDSGGGNPAVRQALAALAQAELDLSNTTIVAQADGVVTNLRLAPGQFVSRAQPLLSFIRRGPRWISADMRENQLGNLARGNRVLVVLDHSPGQVFEGRVESIGWGITQGGEAPTGQLPTVEADTGWLREPQRFPVRIMLIPTNEGEELAMGRSGAQANVIVFTDQNSLLNPIGRLWIWIVAWLSYLQ
jgi:multidrug resistance efflux pump